MIRVGVCFGLGLVLVLALLHPSAAGAETLDAYTDPLPPNPDLPVTQARVLWAGAYCDGDSCPPAATVTRTDDHATQTALPGAHAVGRLVATGGLDGMTVVGIDTLAQRLRITAVDVGESLTSLDYPETPQATGLSIDFTGGGANALALEISGQWQNGSTILNCSLEVSSVGMSESEQHAQSVEAPGMVIFPFDTFTPQLDFSQIDHVSLVISVYGSADLDIGPVHSIASSTPVTTTSWGALKALYR